MYIIHRFVLGWSNRRLCSLAKFLFITPLLGSLLTAGCFHLSIAEIQQKCNLILLSGRTVPLCVNTQLFIFFLALNWQFGRVQRVSLDVRWPSTTTWFNSEIPHEAPTEEGSERMVLAA